MCTFKKQLHPPDKYKNTYLADVTRGLTPECQVGNLTGRFSIHYKSTSYVKVSVEEEIFCSSPSFCFTIA